VLSNWSAACGWLVGGGDDIAARTVDLVGQAQRDRLSGDGLIQITAQRNDPGDRAGLARWQYPHLVARLDAAGGDQAGKAPEVEVRAVDPLHRQAKRLCRIGRGNHLDRFQMLDQGRTGYHGVLATGGDVVALEPGDRHRGEALDPDAAGKSAVLGHDRVEGGLVIIDQVHLVDRQHDVADADQVAQIRMAPGLDQHALARVDQDHRKVGGAGAGHHVAGVLFVPRAVGDDELALFGVEEAVGDIDGDALFALCRQAIDQQGKVDLLPLGANLL
jgi:hypothetical protein